VAEVHRAGRELFDAIRLDARRQAGGDRVPLPPDAPDRFAPVAESFTRALADLRRLLASQAGVRNDLDAMAARADAIRADLKTLLNAADPRYVHFVEVRTRNVTLRAAPIDASDIIRDRILSGRHGSVLTSATLAVGGDFSYALSRLGLPDARTLQLHPEFDFGRQALLYLPASMPDPRTPGFNAAAASAIEELLMCTAGRAFVLFTSYAAMRDVHARLAGRLPWPLLLQGTAPRPALLREFRATPHAVLLATSSFWQGVDVAGDALSCVIVDRLPFASPADPLVAARMAAIAAAGEHPFQAYQVPLATITLLQGLGRLIRTKTDRGVMTVLDPRLTRMSYGRRFLASLPPAPVTRDPADVRAFLGRNASLRRGPR